MSENFLPKLQQDTVIAEGISFKAFLERYEDQAVEWHAGKMIAKVSNNATHQFILGFRHHLFSHFLALHNLGVALFDGYQMYVSDDTPALQPDLMVILNENKERIQPQYLEGAVDLVLEVLSPSTSSVDRGAKFDEYEAAGVQEYWLIDPMRSHVQAYALDAENRYQPIERRESRFYSSVLIGFYIDPAWLWRETLPNSIEALEFVQAMAANEE